MKANRKFVEGEEAVSAVIGVILMVAITVAIAATVYVYVTGIVPTTSSTTENAGVTVSETSDDRIKVTLASAGQSYGSGYAEATIHVMVNGTEAGGTLDVGDSIWTVGESILIGREVEDTGDVEIYSGGFGLTTATSYDITVTILDTVVFDGTVSVV